MAFMYMVELAAVQSTLTHLFIQTHTFPWQLNIPLAVSIPSRTFFIDNVTLLPVSFLSLPKKGYLTFQVFIGFSGVAVTFYCCFILSVLLLAKGKEEMQNREDMNCLVGVFEKVQGSFILSSVLIVTFGELSCVPGKTCQESRPRWPCEENASERDCTCLNVIQLDL